MSRLSLVEELLGILQASELVLLEQSFFSAYRKNEFIADIKRCIDTQAKLLNEILLKEMEGLKTRRLGERYEKFWKIIFDLHPHFELIANNVQIIREKETLGELDLIVKDIKCNQLLHIELACKFYLLKGSGEQLSHWIGPGKKDRLDLKVNKLLNHQLRLSSQSRANKLIIEQFGNIDRHFCIIQGYWFSDIHSKKPHLSYHYPHNMKLGISKGVWGDCTALSRAFSHQYWQWRVASKKEWLPEQTINGEEVTLDKLLAQPIDFPKMLLAFHGEQEVSRCFWVPDYW